jgi:hypothetical protein
MTVCSICKKEAIDTHHINYQSNSDDNGFFPNFHQDTKHNLIPLCKECHVNEHSGVIKIKGYKMTSEGRIVDYEKVNQCGVLNENDVSIEVSNDDLNKLRQYIRRGKCNWFVRSVKTSVFKECTSMNKITEKINKLLKRNVTVDVTTDTQILNGLYDPTM